MKRRFLNFLAFFLCTLPFSKEECIVVENGKVVQCTRTSLEEYVYEILKSVNTYEFPLDFHGVENISITNSNFQHIDKELQNPMEYTKINKAPVSILEIKNSSIETVKSYAFKNFQFLRILDLSHNFIKEISFGFDKFDRLNPSNKNIIDLRNFVLSEIDLSYNNIKEVEIVCADIDRKSKIVNLGYNQIETIFFYKQYCSFEKVNLKGNTNLSKMSDLHGEPVHLWSIKMPHILDKNGSALSVRAKFEYDLSNIKVDDLKGNITDFVSMIYYKMFELNLSNCSLINIDKYFFKDADIINLYLNDNNFEKFDRPIFSNSTVYYLNISNSKIKSISRIFKSFSCKTINLSHNSISRLGMKSFDEIKSVENLDLTLNKLKKLHNSSFVNCNGLQTLNISHNNINLIEILSFYSLESLKNLDLGFNDLTELKAIIFNPLKNLKELSLERNNLIEIETDVFKKLSLVKLNLKQINFVSLKEDQFSDATNLEKIEALTIESINSNSFKNLAKVESLEILGVRHINFSQNVINKNIKSLAIKGYDILKLNSRCFSDLVNLRNVTVWASAIEIDSSTFVGLFNLEILKFPSTNILKYNNESLKGLFNVVELDVKVFFENEKVILPGFFEDLNSVTKLDLGKLNLKEILDFAFKGLRNVENLTLSHNNLRVLTSNAFVGLDNLKILNISFSNTQDIQNYTFYGFTKLEHLDLQGNNLKNLSDFKFNLQSLLHLNLRNCRITKLSKDVFRYLKKLETLNLKNNLIDQIEDLQIESFAHIPNLKELNLANNFIEDFKVGIFSNLGKLLILDLSNNNITKFVIESFIPLKSLEYLNLDKNHLKTLNILQFLPYANNLKRIGISKNKLPCDKLGVMIKELRNKTISFETTDPSFEVDNIEGIECVDACKFLFCLKDTHGIN